LESWADAAGVPTTVLWVLVGVFGALAVGTAARLAYLPSAPPDRRKSRLGSLAAWWIMALAFAIVVLAGRAATIVLFCAASLRGLHEFLRMTAPRDGAGGPLRVLAFAAVPLHYLWIHLGWLDLVRTFLPVFVFLLLPARILLTDRTAGFIPAVADVAWGLGLVVYCFSHAVLLFTLPASANPVGGAAGWILYLVILTEGHDIAQALWGRRFGRHRLVPHVSPGKTREGLLLGTLSTLVVAVLLAPLLTPLAEGPAASDRLVRPLLAGLLIAVAGLFGDLTMSGVKRDVGVKDSGNLIPGQGGLLDRIDSLTFTAPVFFYFAYFLYGS